MNFLGKIIGFIFGWRFGGFFGAVVGLILGHLADKKLYELGSVNSSFLKINSLVNRSLCKLLLPY